MKIGLFFGSLEGGGAERMMVNLSKGLIKYDLEIDIILVNYRGVYKSEVPNNVKIIDLKAISGVKSIFHKLLIKLVRNEYDLIISTQSHINIAITIASILTKSKTKIVLREANTPSMHISGKIVKYVYGYIYNKSHFIISVSNGVKDDLIQFPFIDPLKCKVIYNPVIDDLVSLRKVKEVEDPLLFDQQIPVIVSMGSFKPQKNFKLLINSFNRVRRVRDCRLIIFGKKYEQSDYYKDLVKLRESSTYKNDIHFYGFVENPFKYLYNSDVFVLSSDFEGLPGVIIQALACGCTVVSTDCKSGPREILGNEEYGYLSKVNDERMLADKIQTAINNKFDPDKLTKRANEFSIDKAASEYYQVIKLLTRDDF